MAEAPRIDPPPADYLREALDGFLQRIVDEHGTTDHAWLVRCAKDNLAALRSVGEAPVPAPQDLYEELVAAVLTYSTLPRGRWHRAAIVALARAHAEDSQTVDRQDAAVPALRALHEGCHDLVCSGSRQHPRGATGVSCSCQSRDTAFADLAALRALQEQEHARNTADDSRGDSVSGGRDRVAVVGHMADETEVAALRALVGQLLDVCREFDSFARLDEATGDDGMWEDDYRAIVEHARDAIAKADQLDSLLGVPPAPSGLGD